MHKFNTTKRAEVTQGVCSSQKCYEVRIETMTFISGLYELSF